MFNHGLNNSLKYAHNLKCKTRAGLALVAINLWVTKREPKEQSCRLPEQVFGSCLLVITSYVICL
jgi:hypothetical protein